MVDGQLLSWLLVQWWRIMANLGLGIGLSRGSAHGIEEILPDEYSLAFDGVGDHIDAGTNLTDDLGNTYAGDLSVSFWFKILTGESDNDQGLLMFGPFDSNVGAFQIWQANDLIKMGLLSGATQWRRTVAVPTENVWHHLVCVYDNNGASDTLMYLNNVSVGAIDGTHNTFPTTAQMNFNGLKLIIAGYWDGSYMWKGSMDQIAIYTKALTAGEVNSLYGGGAPTTGGNASEISTLVTSYRLETGSGSTAFDSSINGYDAPISGDSAWEAH